MHMQSTVLFLNGVLFAPTTKIFTKTKKHSKNFEKKQKNKSIARELKELHRFSYILRQKQNTEKAAASF